MATIRSIKSLTLDLPPSCIEFWPEKPSYAVIGTYNLQESVSSQDTGAEQVLDETATEEPQKRNGSLVLVCIDGDDVTIVDTHQTESAILDLHFWPLRSPGITFSSATFLAATSTGSLEYYRIVLDSSSTPKYSISHLETIQVFAKDDVVTSFAIHPVKDFCILCTLQTGEVHLYDFRPESRTGPNNEVKEIQKHKFDAWTAAFGQSGLTTYTGGDDCALKRGRLPANPYALFDQDADLDELSQWSDNKIHTAGVTAILPLILMADVDLDLIVTGSYDDHIRLLGTSGAGHRSVLAELKLGGGVWRLKLLDRTFPQTITILASCMHAGTRIVKLIKDGDNWRFEVVAKFEEHKSMNYATDCQPDTISWDKRTFLSTSFYDKLLCLWRH
ncbi:hypothetical protein BDV96DRAFT_499462 [Lophiotrema nucula]|uniref:WD40-repeat-containing domain protein n=1 Tax=Lophiotrema nucula TaxID=690887 RepID=A0A6A5YWK6_9PLEO|nr:hypothetical protein BDV96DRAFT_499462 [Lophiotrema nucula]